MNEVEVEEWKDIAGYEGMYRVSNTGLVASLDRVSCGRRIKGRMMKKLPNKAGQIAVCLCKDGVARKRLISGLVAAAFIGPRPPGAEVIHLDGDIANDRVENLKYGTPKEKNAVSMKNVCGAYRDIPKSALTQDYLRTVVSYRDGQLFLNVRTAYHQRIGDPIGYQRTDGSGFQAKLLGQTYELPRLIYFYHHGTWPDYVLTKDGDRNNTKIENLREATASEWAKECDRVQNIYQ